ncbi:MAG: hypothetical protein KHX84_21270, partial [Enterocloster asparagiformis]|nr:hypothetical protein [Enterocloster asparagiformis]
MYLRQMNEEETQILHDVSRDALMEYTRGVSRWVRISSLQEEVVGLKLFQFVLLFPYLARYLLQLRNFLFQ